MIRNRPSSPSLSNNDHNEAYQGGGRRIKRTRAVLVCNRCKSLKTRCDLGRPCSTCTKAKVEDKCIYEPWKGQPQTAPFDESTTNHSAQTTSSAGPGPSTIEDRLNQVETHLSRIESLLSKRVDSEHLTLSTKAGNLSDDDEWQFLLSQLPPFQLAEQLIGKYFILDTLLRYTHQPSYLQHFHQNYPKNINQTDETLTKEKASYFASVCLAMVIGTTLDTENLEDDSTQHPPTLINTLLSLHQRFVEISESLLPTRSNDPDPSIAYYHLHALMLRTEKSMKDSSSSLAQTWFDMGKIYSTALYLDLHLDPDEGPVQFSPFWKEMRRRMWWLLYSGEKIATQKLRLPTLLPASNVRKPVLIPDIDLREDLTQAQLDDQYFLSQLFTSTTTTVADLTPPEILVASTGRSAPAEWAFIDAKIRTTQLMTDLMKLRITSDQIPQLSTMEKIDRLTDQLNSIIPEHLKFETLSTAQTRDCPINSPDQPPWLLAQACVMNIGITSVILNAYQPYLSLTTEIHTNAQLVQHALNNTLEAAHILIVTAEVFVWHITFRWPEGKSLFSWNLGSRLFSAGVLVALTALRGGNDHQGWKGWINDLRSAEGLMKILSDHTSRKSQTTTSKGGIADLKALKILRQLSERVNLDSNHYGQTPNSIATSTSITSLSSNQRLIDPYTAYEMSEISSPQTIPLQNDSSTPTDSAIPENFTLEDLEALLTEVYGNTGVNAG